MANHQDPQQEQTEPLAVGQTEELVADMPAVDRLAAGIQVAVEPTDTQAADIQAAVAENSHPAALRPQDDDQEALAHQQQSL